MLQTTLFPYLTEAIRAYQREYDIAPAHAARVIKRHLQVMAEFQLGPFDISHDEDGTPAGWPPELDYHKHMERGLEVKQWKRH